MELVAGTAVHLARKVAVVISVAVYLCFRKLSVNVGRTGPGGAIPFGDLVRGTAQTGQDVSVIEIRGQVNRPTIYQRERVTPK